MNFKVIAAGAVYVLSGVAILTAVYGSKPKQQKETKSEQSE